MEAVKFIGLDADRLSTMLKALSHPVRLEIVQILSDSGDANCVDFTRHAGLAQSTVSEHLRVLREAGLIKQCDPARAPATASSRTPWSGLSSRWWRYER